MMKLIDSRLNKRAVLLARDRTDKTLFFHAMVLFNQLGSTCQERFLTHI